MTTLAAWMIVAVLGEKQLWPSVPHEWYGEYVFHGRFACVTGGGGSRLQAGDEVLVLTEGEPPALTRVEQVRRAGESWSDRRPFDAGCKEDGPDVEWKGELDLANAYRHGALFAIKRTAPGLVAIGGNRQTLSLEESRTVAASMTRHLPGKYRSPHLLARAYRYGPYRGHDALELHLGIVAQRRSGSDRIDKISILRVYIVDGQFRGAEEYDRTSGEEERVDSGEIELTADTWWISETEYTIGFISRDSGRTWDRLSIDWGFESLWWRAQTLRDAAPLPILYEVNERNRL